MPDFILIFGVIAVVLTVSALASGLVERSPLSFPLIFLGLGFLLGSKGFDLLEVGPHSPFLEVVATLTLALVLFLDAVKLQVTELGKRWLVPALILGPGTGLIIAIGALPFGLFLNFGWILAFIGGAVLASTDPVVLRDIVRDERIPRSVRQVLKIEAGMNDLVVLPVVLVLIAVATDQSSGIGGWSVFLVKLLLLGPAIGFAVGGLGSWVMNWMDKKMTIRSDHQSLYGIGLVLASYTAATAAGGDGFLGAFAAGLAVVILNQSLCDCFLEYGEVTSEMAMLLAFVLFGVVLSGLLETVDIVPTLGLAALVVFAIRPAVLGVVLAKARMSWQAHAFVSWFGPRGLNSLLLALLVVQAGIPGSELLLAVVGVVVMASVAIHGGTATPVGIWYGRAAARETFEEERESTVAGLFGRHEGEVPRLTPQELSGLLSQPDPPVVVDVRTRASYNHDGTRIPGSVRVLPDAALEWAGDRPPGQAVVTYCS
ncbi:MAG: cation:proton antiporter [Chloroflexi bacterium]|nr:cation:proton antiporter [Chloroflexota bacterium]